MAKAKTEPNVLGTAIPIGEGDTVYVEALTTVSQLHLEVVERFARKIRDYAAAKQLDLTRVELRAHNAPAGTVMLADPQEITQRDDYAAELQGAIAKALALLAQDDTPEAVEALREAIGAEDELEVPAEGG